MAWSCRGWRWRGFAPIRSNAIALGDVVGSLQLAGLKPRRQMPELRRRRRYGKRRRRNPCRRRHLRHCVIVAHRARVALKRCYNSRLAVLNIGPVRQLHRSPGAGERAGSGSVPLKLHCCPKNSFPHHLPPPPVPLFDPSLLFRLPRGSGSQVSISRRFSFVLLKPPSNRWVFGFGFVWLFNRACL